jgi:hypothetical protein
MAQDFLQQLKARLPEASFEDFLSLQQELAVSYHEADTSSIERSMERAAAMLTQDEKKVRRLGCCVRR